MSMILWTMPGGAKTWTACADGVIEAAHADKLLADGIMPAGSTYEIVDTLPAGEVAKLEKAARNARRKARLAELDAKSVRGLREFVLAKWPADAAIPAALKTAEADAAAERAALEQ